MQEFHVWFHNRNRTPSSYVVLLAVAAPAATILAFVPAAIVGDGDDAVTNNDEDKEDAGVKGTAAPAEAAVEAEAEEEDEEADDDDADDDDADDDNDEDNKADDDDTNFGMVDTCCSCIRNCRFCCCISRICRCS